MIDLLPITIFILFIAYAILAVFYLVSVGKFLSFLKKTHPGVYADLGSPHLFYNNTPKTFWRLMRYLLKQEYLSSADSIVVSRAGMIRGMLVGGVALFGSLDSQSKCNGSP